MEDNERLKSIFLRVFEGLKEEDYVEDKKQAEYENWDSFAHMQLISEVESQFGVSLNVDEVTSIESARDILEVLKKKNG